MLFLSAFFRPLWGWDRPCLTELLGHANSCSLCHATAQPSLSEKQVILRSPGCCFCAVHSERDPPLPLRCLCCSRWLLWCWIWPGVPRTLFSKSRHFVLVLFLDRCEIPVILGSQYSYTLLFHRCVRHTTVGWQRCSCQSRCLSGYLSCIVVTCLSATTVEWSRSRG